MSDYPQVADTLSPKKRQLLELLLKEKEKERKEKKKTASGHQAAVAAKAAVETIPRRAKVSPAPVSFAQQRLWFIDQLTPGTPAFNIPAAIRLSGDVDVDRLKLSFDEIIRRHETLRTSFGSDEGTPVQIIAESASLDIPVLDYRAFPDHTRMEQIRRFVTGECQRSFDLARCPLVRATLLRTGESEYVLVLMMHHIIGDVWSVRVVMKELAAIYESHTTGLPATLPELPIQYADYAVWQREWLQGAVLQSQLGYWRDKLTGMPEELELPIDHQRPAIQSIWGAKYFLKIPRKIVDALRLIGREEKASLFMVLLAAWKMLLTRYTSQTDIVVGIPVANRNRSEYERMVGFFVNSLIFRTDLSNEPTYKDVLQRVRETTLGAFGNQDFPFERLVEVLQPTRNMSRNPLFQTDFILQNAPKSAYHVTGMSFEALPVETGTAQLDMTLDLWEEEDGIEGWLEYDTDIFNRSTAGRMVRHYNLVLEGIVASPGRKLFDYSLLSEEERQQLLVEWNDKAREYDLEHVYSELFESRADTVRDAAAVACDQEHLSYGELNRQANALAIRLRSEGIGRDDVVGLLMRRSIGLLTSIIGVMKSGAGYLPLDPSHPAERHRRIVEQSAVRVIVTTTEFSSVMRDVINGLDTAESPAVLHLGSADECAAGDAAAGEINATALASPDSLAYVIFTSGSTGAPKGVMIHQRGMVNHLWANIEELNLTSEDVLAQTASQCFDISVWQFLAMPLLGGRVQIFPDRITQDPAKLLIETDRTGVTVLEMVPSLLQVGLSEIKSIQRGRPRMKSLRWLLPTGEAVPADLCRTWFKQYPHVPLMNAYGPSECSDDVTLLAFDAPPGKDSLRVSIGAPVGNLGVSVLDRELRPLPIGVAGELCVMGTGVGRGYLGMPERTASYFVPDPFSAEEGARMYRSGDRARYLPDGRLDFLGRMDFQVKIRGFRIELGEIESIMRRHPMVAESVVMAREDTPGNQRLVGYIVPGEGAGPFADELREYLRLHLPEYMVPTAFVTLDAMPLSPNGKIDRKALPVPEGGSGRDYIAPRNSTEELLGVMWCEKLSMERISVEDNLFELGAHSLLVTQIVSRIRKTFGVEPPLRLFFEYPTIAGMSRVIEKLRSEADGTALPPIVRIPRDGLLPLSFTQERMWFLDQLEPGLTAYNVPGAVYMEGALSPICLEEGFTQIVRRHEIFRTTYDSVDGKPIQIIHPPYRYEMPFVDLRDLAEDDRESEALRLARENAQRPFDLGSDRILRCFLIRYGEDKHMAAMTTHHIAYDMVARELFLAELAANYPPFLIGEQSPLPEPEVQWADYAAWQRQWMQGEVLENQLSYWKKKLAGAPPYLDLPVDLPRPRVQSYRGARQYLQLPLSLTDGVAAVSKKRGVTPFITYLSAFKTILVKYSGQEKIVVGAPIANRNRLEVEKLMGFVANTIVLYTDAAGNPRFSDLQQLVRETTVGAQAHQDVPFEFLVQAILPERDMSRSPIFQVMFNFMLNYAPPKIDLSELTLSLERLHSGAAQFEINVDMWQTDDGFNGVVEYCTDLLHHSTITRFIGHFRSVLEAVVIDPDRRLSEYSLLSESEHHHVLSEWNDTDVHYDLEPVFSRVFESQAYERQDAIAAQCDLDQVSYGELNERANAVAWKLFERGAGPDSVVALLAKRGIGLLTSILGALKTGAAYLPLDPEHPVGRYQKILSQSGTGFVIASEEFIPSMQETLSMMGPAIAPELLALESMPSTEARGELPIAAEQGNLAYIIFTSGSTGAPKGVMIEQAGMLNHLWANIDALGMTERDILAQTASQCFDISVWQFLAPLILGGRVRIFTDEDTQDPPRLLKNIDRDMVTVLEMVPSLLQVGLSGFNLEGHVAPAMRSLRWLLPTGEAVPAALCRDWLDNYPDVPLMNAYGPSECSDDVTLQPLSYSPGEESRYAAIGRPVGNLTVTLLDSKLEQMPLGIPGELCIGGIGVGRGYFGMPDRTAAAFVPDPFAKQAGARIYRSGDRARYLTDGRLEFLGRMDHQVKVRGFRIELGEIESALGQHPDIGEAAVLVREDSPGNQRLVAYLVVKNGSLPESNDLRASLKQYLPDYMIPAAFVNLEAMPLTPNGKIDRKALPIPGVDVQASAAAPFVEPRNDIELEIAAIWKEILGVEKAGVYDDFFDAGGHSLLVVQFLSRVRDRMQVEIPLKAFFEYSTISDVGKTVSAVRWARESLDVSLQAEAAEAVFEEGVL